MNKYQFIHKSDGTFEKAPDLIPETLKQIGKACANGSVDMLETILKSLQPDQLGRYLNAMIQNYQLSHHTYYTPLMIASANGHDSIVCFLLKNYADYCIVDAENYSSDYDFDYHCDHEHFNKQTAFWLAVKYKHLNVVQTLISHSQVNINQQADDHYSVSNWTPLYLACNNNQLEMVKYLIEHGADLYHVDKDDSTALMIASKRGNDDLVKYLLSLDDNNNHFLNAVNNEGSTALHQAAGSKQLEIVKLLLEEYHAEIIKDNDGCTPLTNAGINNYEEVVKYFIETEKQSWYTISEVIDELELIGSYHLVHHDYREECFKRAYHYLLWAMKLRYKNPKAPILKTNLLSSNKAYGNYTECQTIEDLRVIAKNGNDTSLILECLMIRERNGITSKFLQLLHDQADSFAYDLYSFDPDTYVGEEEQCQHAFQLWLHAYHLRIQTQIDLHKCVSHLEQCIRLMGDLIGRKRAKDIQFDMILEILQAVENEYLRNNNLPFEPYVFPENNDVTFILEYAKKEEESGLINGNKCLYIILNLLFIAMKIVSSSNKNKEQRRKIILQRVRQLIKSDYRTISDQKTLLHLALLTSHNNKSISSGAGFPSLEVVELLLSCEVPINAIDLHHYTPLHDFASNNFEEYTNEEFGGMKRIFNLLVNAGAHLDAVANGKTPEACAEDKKMKSLFRKHPTQLNLKCICARMIRKNELNYGACVSKRLQTFIELH